MPLSVLAPLAIWICSPYPVNAAHKIIAFHKIIVGSTWRRPVFVSARSCAIRVPPPREQARRSKPNRLPRGEWQDRAQISAPAHHDCHRPLSPEAPADDRRMPKPPDCRPRDARGNPSKSQMHTPPPDDIGGE